jgi:eukaryotic-like serine/threonine-protein kinase
VGSQHEDANQARKACVLCGKEFSGNIEQCPDDGTLLTPIGKEPRVGEIFADRYEILGILGDGGMGKVYKARHNLMKRVVAIKMLLPHLVQSGPALKRFQQEAQAASALKHPHIMTVHDFGISDRGMPFLVMDYLEGMSLSALLQELGAVPQDRAVNIFIQACSALSHAHKNNVIHRDLKPANLMLIDFDGQPDFLMVVDFGIAKLLQPEGAAEQLTHTGEVFGSPLYMSPEQCRGKELDARSDIYSLGCVMYRTLTGHPVFGGRDAMECMYKQVNDLPGSFSDVCPELGLSDKLESAIFKAIAKNPADRFQTMADFRDSLEKVKGRAVPVSRVFSVPRMSGQEVAYDASTDRLKRAESEAPPAAAADSKQAAPVDAAAEESVKQAAPLDTAAEESVKQAAPVDAQTPETVKPEEIPESTPPVSENISEDLSERISKPETKPACTTVPAAPPDSSSSKAPPLKLALIAGGLLIALAAAGALISMSGRHDTTISNPAPGTTGTAAGEVKGTRSTDQLSQAKNQIASGQYQSAEQTLNQAVGTAQSEPELAAALPVQAGVYEQSGKYAQAQATWERLLALQEKDREKASVIATTKSHLALPLLDQGKIDAAEPLLNDAEKVLSASPAKDQEALCQVYYGLSKIALKRGDYNGATATLQKAIDHRTRTGGAENLDLLQYWQDLADVYLVQGKLVDAEVTLQKMLKLADRKLGTESAQAADAYKGLGTLYFQKGQLRKAETYFKKSLSIKSNDFGAKSVSAAEVMAALAMLYTREKKYQQAEPLFKQSLEIRTRELGADSPQAKRTKELYATFQKLRK